MYTAIHACTCAHCMFSLCNPHISCILSYHYHSLNNLLQFPIFPPTLYIYLHLPPYSLPQCPSTFLPLGPLVPHNSSHTSNFITHTHQLPMTPTSSIPPAHSHTYPHLLPLLHMPPHGPHFLHSP